MGSGFRVRIPSIPNESVGNVPIYLQESKRNVLKDFVHIAGPLGVTQFLILTATENACYLRIAKTPRVRHRPLAMLQHLFVATYERQKSVLRCAVLCCAVLCCAVLSCDHCVCNTT